jgi:hypothetical protein
MTSPRIGEVNSLCEEPSFSCRQGGGSPPPAARGSPSSIRAVSEQHLHAVLSLVRRTGRRSSVPLASRPSSNRFGRFPTNAGRGVSRMVCCPAGTVCHTLSLSPSAPSRRARIPHGNYHDRASRRSDEHQDDSEHVNHGALSNATETREAAD